MTQSQGQYYDREGERLDTMQAVSILQLVWQTTRCLTYAERVLLSIWLQVRRELRHRVLPNAHVISAGGA